VYVELYLHTCDQTKLILDYDLCNILLISLFKYFIENFVSIVIRDIGLSFPFHLVLVSGLPRMCLVEFLPFLFLE
jgi:hypothetical protein